MEVSTQIVFNTMQTDEIIFRENADEKSNRPRTETLRKSQHSDKGETNEETEKDHF